MENGWIQEKVFFNQKDFFDHLLIGISKAKLSIDFETYIFSNDQLGQRVIKYLEEAKERGVKVRALIDGFGSPFSAWEVIPKLRRAGVDARVFHPLRKFSLINKRNHRKVCIVDESQVWAGGMNVCFDHSTWRDTGAFVEGPQTHDFSIAFQNSWNAGWWQGSTLKNIGQKLSTGLRPGHWVRLNQGHKERKKSYQQLIIKISQVKQRAWITNAYFIPTTRLLRSLIVAAENKADVRLLLSHSSDVFFISWVSAIFYYPLLKAGVRIYEYLPAPLHAKTMLLDDWSMVGSSNLNHRSLLHDLEGDVILRKPETINKMKNQFEIDLRNSQEITLKEWYNRPIIPRIFGRILFQLRNWM